MSASEPTSPARQKGFLGAVERLGNLLPEPVMIFVWLILGLMVLSAVGQVLGWSASITYSGDEAPPFSELENGVLTYAASSLFSEANLARLFTEMPKTLTGFAPLGLVLVVILGAAVAERSGLFSALIRASLREAPRAILTPLLIPPFALAFGWQAAFWVTGALGFIWLAGWWFGTRNLKPLGDMPERARVPWGVLLSDRKTWTVIGAKFCIDAVWWFVLFWMPDFFNRQFGLGQGALGWPIAIIFTLAALGALTSGGLYPILLSRDFSVNAARKTSMLFYALVVLAMPLALLTDNPWLAAVLIGLGLFAHQGFSTNVFGMTADIIPATRVASVIALGAIAG
ncbi:MAG: hypothetical protein B7X78_09210, partial [Sphingomonadales bacterium 39-62-4]